MHRITFVLSILVLIISSISATSFAAGAGIEGNVKDSKTGEPLFGANVIIVGTSLGGATDMDGNYVIPAINPGTYTIRVTYIGYVEQKAEILIAAGTHLKKNFKLEAVGIEGKVVVVTAQASGQKAAINQQLTSDQIVNVVSAAKIQELPDANAAESVGRLPGISIQRSGGEGNAVVIRGLAPKYNEIMLDGIKMSSTDSDDRSTDLSMVSSNMLDGIQVSKTVTPDMDADVLGGTVNFEMKEAKVKVPGVPQYSLQVQGGYNGLTDIYNKFNNYKYVGSVEDRFLDDKLGVFAQVDIERKNLSSNEMGASYDELNNNMTDYQTTALNLYYISRDRQRYNGALVIDYKLPEGKIKFTNFFSSGTTTDMVRGEKFDITANTVDYTLANSNNRLGIITNGLDIQQQLPIFKMDLKLSHSYSESKSPDSWTADFLQTSVGIGQRFSGKNNVNPMDISKAASTDLSDTYFNTFTNTSDFSRERSLTASLDLKTNVNLSDMVTAEIKFGGKYRHQTRSYVYTKYDITLSGGNGKLVNSAIESNFNLPANEHILINQFQDPSFSYGKFLDGNYTMIAPLNYAMLQQTADLLKRNISYFASNGSNLYDYVESTTHNYDGHENLSAFYVMSNVNIGSEITFIPGVRYQNLQTTYSAPRGITTSDPLSYNHYDTTVVQSHGYWLPDVVLRYKPLSWFDVRLSYTNTLSYPDYTSIVPRINLSSTSISWLDYKLKPSRSSNYDLYLSFYDNTIGLFTIGGFLKQIDNLIYSKDFYVKGAAVLQYMPTSIMSTYVPNTSYHIYTKVNNPYRINDYGMELDWQTHFWYLPGPLSGLVFSANYTHIFSKAEYPNTLTVTTVRTITHIDTSYKDRLIDQPDDIINLSLGFDYQDFSIRVSMLYQSDIFTGANFWAQLRSHTSAYRRWDLSAKQELPWFGIQVYGDVNNINGANDVSVIQATTGVPTSEQDYGLSADFGIRLKL